MQQLCLVFIETESLIVSLAVAIGCICSCLQQLIVVAQHHLQSLNIHQLRRQSVLSLPWKRVGV